MAHDVFISHSHQDKPAADAARAALEAKGIRCWIAPRDINPGQDWAASIIRAIRDAQIVLLIFSRHANESLQVKREVERAAHSGKAILPLRIDDVLPEETLEFFLSTPHWLDAITPPFEAHLEKLADACTILLAVAPRSPQDADQGCATSVTEPRTASPTPIVGDFARSVAVGAHPAPSASPQVVLPFTGLSSLSGEAVDAAGTVYVADTGNDRAVKPILEADQAQGSQDDGSVEAALNLGMQREEQGDVAGAAAAYQIAIDSGHADWAPKAAFNLGFLRENKQGDVAGAAAAYQIAIDSGHVEWALMAAVNLGLLRENKQGDMAGAAAAYQIAIDSGHADHAPKAAVNLGLLRENKQGDVAGAAAAYQMAIDYGHAEWAPMAAFNLGLLRENKQGDVAGAAAAYQMAIDYGHAEWATRAALHLGALREQEGDVAGAAAACQIAIDASHAEWTPLAARALGMLREDQGDLAGAAAAYQIAVDYGDVEWAQKAALNLGMLREKQGDLAGATAAYQIATNSSDTEWATEAARRLRGLGE